MRHAMRRFIPAVLLLVTTLSGCDGSSGGDAGGSTEGKLGPAPYLVVNAGDLERTEFLLKGSGSVAFKDPIGEISSKKDYALSFSLDDGGSLALVAHGDEKLQNGVEVTLSRAGSALSATLSAGGKKAVPKVLKDVDATTAMTVNIDVHNDESPSHILLWSGSDFAEEKALLNSEEDGPTPGQGSATFWGLVLTKANVTSATITEPKFLKE